MFFEMLWGEERKCSATVVGLDLVLASKNDGSQSTKHTLHFVSCLLSFEKKALKARFTLACVTDRQNRRYRTIPGFRDASGCNAG